MSEPIYHLFFDAVIKFLTFSLNESNKWKSNGGQISCSTNSQISRGLAIVIWDFEIIKQFYSNSQSKVITEIPTYCSESIIILSNCFAFTTICVFNYWMILVPVYLNFSFITCSSSSSSLWSLSVINIVSLQLMTTSERRLFFL